MEQQIDTYNYLFKIIIIGDSGVGKTSILNRFIDNTFSSHYISTIGVDFKLKNIKINDENIKLQLWDTAGQERFKTITSNYYRGAHCIFLVFDMSDTDTLTNISVWMEEVKQKCDDGLFIIVGNKMELQNIKEKEITKILKINEIDDTCFYKVSAKDATNVDEMFDSVTKKLVVKFKGVTRRVDNNFFKEHKSSQRKCC